MWGGAVCTHPMSRPFFLIGWELGPRRLMTLGLVRCLRRGLRRSAISATVWINATVRW